MLPGFDELCLEASCSLIGNNQRIAKCIKSRDVHKASLKFTAKMIYFISAKWMLLRDLSLMFISRSVLVLALSLTFMLKNTASPPPHTQLLRILIHH